MKSIRDLINVIEQLDAEPSETDEAKVKEGLFGKKPKGPSQARINQVTTPRDQKKDAEDWGGEGYFDYRNSKKKRS